MQHTTTISDTSVYNSVTQALQNIETAGYQIKDFRYPLQGEDYWPDSFAVVPLRCTADHGPFNGKPLYIVEKKHLLLSELINSHPCNETRVTTAYKVQDIHNPDFIYVIILVSVDGCIRPIDTEEFRYLCHKDEYRNYRIIRKIPIRKITG